MIDHISAKMSKYLSLAGSPSMDIQKFSSIIILSAFLVFLFMAGKRLRSKSLSSKSKLPPGPWKLPLIGNLHNMLGLVPVPHRTLGNLAKKYGPLMQLQLGEVPILVVSSPSVAKQIMKNHDFIFADRPEFYAGKILFYNSTDLAFARYGDYWRDMRKDYVMHFLSAKHMQLFRPLREEEVSNMTKTLSLQAGVPVNLSKRVTSMFSTITSRAAFRDSSKVSEDVISMIGESLTLVGMSMEDLFPSLKLIHCLGGVTSRMLRLHREIDKVLEGIIHDHKTSRIGRKEDDNDANLEEALLDVLLQQSGESSLTTENIKAAILEILIGGTFTSATAILWAMSELLLNQKVMEKVQTEVRRVFNGKKHIEETGVDKLEYFKLVIQETLRLHPPSPLTLRESRECCKIDGYDIAAKTKVIINLWAIGRDPDYWSDPDMFEPERFDGNSVNYKGTYFEYIPFGAGRRMCPGISFAMASVELTLAHLLYHFDWKIAQGQDIDMEERFGVSVTRKRDLILIPIPFVAR